MPYNNCLIVITRGKNKGKTCSEVNKQCRHCNMSCPHCGTNFTIETSYYRHINSCRDLVTPKSVKDYITNRKKVKIGVKQNTHAMSELSGRMLLQKIENLEKELEKVKNQPTTIHQWNIVLGSNFYEELVSKMGKADAISFLTSIAVQGNGIDVIRKLYLENSAPDDYPIACQNTDHFRYIDSDHQLVDDKGGQSIGRLVSSGIHNAIILAANEMISQQVAGDTNENQSYDRHDTIISIQSHIAGLCHSMTTERIVSDLAHVTCNPNHPFFLDPNEA